MTVVFSPWIRARLVDGDHRQLGVDQLRHHGVREIRRGDDHAVDPAIAAVLQVGGSAASEIVDKGNVVVAALGLAADPVQHRREELVRETAVHGIDEEDAEVVGALGLQRPGCGVGHVAHLLRRAEDAAPGLLPDVELTVERLAHRGDRDTAAMCNVLHGYHGINTSLNRLREQNVTHFARECKSFFSLFLPRIIFCKNCTERARVFCGLLIAADTP